MPKQHLRPFSFLLLAFAALLGAACAGSSSDASGGAGGQGTVTGATVTSSSSTGGAGGASLCSQDCTQVATPPCLKSVCNDGSYLGTVGACVVVPDDGKDCDDGLYCTTKDKCSAGVCVGGPQNDCGMAPPECTSLTCNESTKTCSPVQMDEGAACTPVSDLCQVNATCHNGQCKGVAKDCSFSPFIECNSVACEPATGLCKPTPDTTKNAALCNLTGDPCHIGKSCLAGACQGGTAKDCSPLTVDCVVGTCNAQSGTCEAIPIAPGGMCAGGTNDCNVGICSTNGTCDPTPVTNGTACNDHNACTSSDSCTAGVCSGTSVTGCSVYYSESFETCPAAWTFTGEFQCGVATDITPASADGAQVFGTVLTGNYANNDAFATNTATSPDIDLTTSTSPRLVFSLYNDTEAGYDGINLAISVDGAPYQTIGAGTQCTLANGCTVVTADKPYSSTIASEPAWSARESALGFQRVTFDVSPYVGHHVTLRFAFRSDTSGVFPGAYVDDVVVAEANAVPLSITTASIADGYVGIAYGASLAKVGGTNSSVWSIAGGTNDGWLTINPATGALSGTPGPANQGPVTVKVHVQEPALPSNFDEKTFSFNVAPAPLYFQGFEGACPDGWALTGEWQCGTPSVAGPATAHSGAQCLATVINGLYANNDAYASNTATSPAINLTGTTTPTLGFYVWDDTEGSTYDGFNLSVSTDGGTTFNLLTTVTPAYGLTIASQQAWGGHALGWMPYTADLSALAGQTVLLRFSFRSDTSNTFAGVYIDDVVVAD